MIVGLIGYKQVGKSTAAKHLAKKHGFARHNMKDALVEELKANMPDLLEELAFIYDRDIEKLFSTKPPAMRALMQNYGTEVRRRDDDEYWCQQWQNALPEGNVVVDDVRFQNEAERVIDEGGILIRIKRSDVQTGGNHSSETEQDSIQCDYEIWTEKGEFEPLYDALDDIVADQVKDPS